LAVLSLPVSAFAVIKTPYPLKEVNRAFGEIFEAEVSSVDTKTGKVELSWRKDLKGKTAFAKIVLGRPKTATDLPKLIERVRVGLPVVIFTETKRRKTRVLVYTEGTWFSFPVDPAKRAAEAKKPTTVTGTGPWLFEIYLRRTYSGKTKELLDLLPVALAGKKRWPKLNEKMKPGLGPKLPPPKKERGKKG